MAEAVTIFNVRLNLIKFNHLDFQIFESKPPAYYQKSSGPQLVLNLDNSLSALPD